MTTEENAPVSDDAPVSEKRSLNIDLDNLYPDVAWTYESVPEFRQAVATIHGSRQKAQADARIRELEAEVERLSLTQRRQRFESMDEDERLQALRDPSVAAEYADVMGKRAPDLEQIRQQNAVTVAVEEALDDLRRIGAPPERIETWRAYLRDPSTPLDRSSSAAFVRSVQRAIDVEVHTPKKERFAKYGYGKPPESPPAADEEEAEPEKQPEAPVVAANPRLARAAPDRSQPDGGGKKPKFRTQQEASRLLMEGAISIAEMREAKRTLPYS